MSLLLLMVLPSLGVQKRRITPYAHKSIRRFRDGKDDDISRYIGVAYTGYLKASGPPVRSSAADQQTSA
jgi:hypothetical protein